jgi:hypothetical protein
VTFGDVDIERRRIEDESSKGRERKPSLAIFGNQVTRQLSTPSSMTTLLPTRGQVQMLTSNETHEISMKVLY